MRGAVSQILLSLLIVFISGPVWSRPVSFRGGNIVMSENRAFQSELMIVHTPINNWSLGFHGATLRGFQNDPAKQVDVFAVMMNWLAVRGFGDDWQSNLYFGAGAGGMLTTSIEMDFETRKFYLSARTQGWGPETTDPLTYARARVGFAPYLSEMNGLHTWVLLQAEYHSWTRVTDILPMVRFFYQNILFELGSSFRGRAQFNFVTEF
ncbi:MAG: hypothetical protein K2X47_10740 [Bdellovibrionales bacterium]|nr:hypothetical protein [Bdellovibrionales bacterium]